LIRPSTHDRRFSAALVSAAICAPALATLGAVQNTPIQARAPIWVSVLSQAATFTLVASLVVIGVGILGKMLSNGPRTGLRYMTFGIAVMALCGWGSLSAHNALGGIASYQHGYHQDLSLAFWSAAALGAVGLAVFALGASACRGCPVVRQQRRAAQHDR
jgi:hypothetical protein